MTYHGGPVMQSVTAFAIYWTPNNTIATGYQTLVNRYFQDIGSSSFYNINTQYSQNPGPTFMQNVSNFGGAWVDTTNAYPGGRGTAANPLTDQDIRDEVTRALAANPSWGPADLTRQYLVFQEQGIESCFDSTDCTPGTTHPVYCAYHNTFTSGSNDIIYSNMPYVETWTTQCREFTTSPNGNLAADAEISITSHEHFESATDPHLNAWYDSDLSGEIGDKCAYRYGTVGSNGSNISLKGNAYIVQLEWSNAANNGVAFSGCVNSYTGVDLSVTKTGAPNPVAAGSNLTYTVTVNNLNSALSATNVVLTDPVPANTTFQSVTAPTGWNCTTPGVGGTGNVQCTTSTLAANAAASLSLVVKVNANTPASTTITNTATASSANPDPNTANNSATATTNVVRTTSLAYTGDVTQDYHDVANVSAKLTDALSGSPLAGKTVSFTLGTQTTSGVTNAAGVASGSITITQAPAAVTVSAAFAGDSQYVASNSTPETFTITREETALTYTGATVIANGRSASLSATLKEDGLVAIAGRSVVLTLGTGSTAQSCTATTDASGSGACNISVVSQPLGPSSVSATFAGDTFYLPSSTRSDVVLFAFLAQGTFAVGDQSDTGSVTYWNAQWSALNSLSRIASEAIPNAFKGFAGAPSSNPPACGDTWTSSPAGSPPPPNAVPSYMGVIATSQVSKSGNTLSGDVTSIVVVRTDPNYSATPGPPGTGTGTVVAVYCHP
jgi:uncharacterized repeat protein (TIGR01451 family)